MTLISLKCPNCNGEIQLDDDRESGYCLYCGSKLLFKDVYNNQVELSGRINAEGVPTVENPYVINGLELNQREYEDFIAYVNRGEKIPAIKLIREKTDWGLKESKDFVDNYTGLKGKADIISSINGSKNPYSANSANHANYSGPKKSGACYIATAVYGSYEAPEVMILRTFRDEVLSRSFLGKIFIRFYYAVSPPIANWLRDAKNVNAIARKILDRFVNKLRK